MADPLFGAAVVLDTSRLGSQESAADRNLKRSQLKMLQEKESRASIERGLTSLNKTMEDLKAWEDKEGFKEIRKEHEKVIESYLQLSKGGLNLTAPKTNQEIEAYKAINDAHSRIIQKVDAWGENKKQIDAIQVLEKADRAKPLSQQAIDWGKTYDNIQSQFELGILDRKMNLNTLVAYKPEIGNLDKFIKENESFITIPMVDPVSGVPNPGQVKQQESDLKEIYAGLDDSYMTALKQEKARAEKINKNLEVVPLEDFFVARYSPAARGKLSKQLKDIEDEDKSIKVDFLNSSFKVIPNEKMTNDNRIGGRNYNERYEFNFPTAKMLKVPTNGGSAHIAAADPAKGDDGWRPIGGGSNPDYAEAELLFYDPKTDALVFRSGQAAQNPWIQNNTTFDVPRKNLPNAENLPIMVDGKEKKLKDILPEEDLTKPKELPLPEGFWSKPTYPTKKRQ
jgi:hypothetical protein